MFSALWNACKFLFSHIKSGIENVTKPTTSLCWLLNSSTSLHQSKTCVWATEFIRTNLVCTKSHQYSMKLLSKRPFLNHYPLRQIMPNQAQCIDPADLWEVNHETTNGRYRQAQATLHRLA